MENQILVRNKVRVSRFGPHTPTKNFGEYLPGSSRLQLLGLLETLSLLEVLGFSCLAYLLQLLSLFEILGSLT